MLWIIYLKQLNLKHCNMATTNFNEWIENLSKKNIEDINNLYLSITEACEIGGFKTTINATNGRKFVQTEHNDETLMLATPRAETAFLNILDQKFGGEFGWVIGHWDSVRNDN